MSWVSKKFGVSTTPVERFLLQPATTIEGQMQYEQFLTSYLPRRLQKAMLATEKELESADPARKEWLVENKAEIVTLQEKLDSFVEHLHSMQATGYMADVRKSHAQIAFFEAARQWLSRHHDEKEDTLLDFPNNKTSQGATIRITREELQGYEDQVGKSFADVASLQQINTHMRDDYMRCMENMPLEKRGFIARKKEALHSVFNPRSAQANGWDL